MASWSLWSSIIVGVVAALIATIYYKLKQKRNYFAKRGIPHLDMFFNFWGVPKAMLLRETLEVNLEKVYYNDAVKNKKVFGFYQLFAPVIMVKDPQVIESILIKDFSYFHDRTGEADFETNPLDGQLFALKGQRWKTIRNKLSPVFTTGKIKWMLDQVVKCGDGLAKHFDGIETEQEVLIKKALTLYNMNVIGSCAFGLDIKAFENPDSKFHEAVDHFLNPSPVQFARFVGKFIFPNLVKFFKIKTLPLDVEQFFINLTKDTLKQREETNQKRNDFLQLLLQLKQKGYVDYDDKPDEEDLIEKDTETNNIEFTDEVLAAQVFVFFIAGLESTATLAAYTLLYLAENPEIQKKVRKEIHEAVEKHGAVTYDCLKSMTYLECCMSETLRILPPSTAIFRECTRDYKYNDFTIEKGTMIMIPVQTIHLDKEFFDDPLKYIPERFIDSKYSTRQSCGVYLPFGDGPRVCIARRFALLQAKVSLVKILQNFEVVKSSKNIDPLQRDPKSMSFQPIGGLWVNLKKSKTQK